MHIINQQLIDEYKKKGDPVLKRLMLQNQTGNKLFTTHKWLLESMPKRMIYHFMYGDLYQEKEKPLKILDVGGGYSTMTHSILKNHDYTLLDIMAHDDHKALRREEESFKRNFWNNQDWFTFRPLGKYDLVIANDLFPNVDQRLELFLEKFLPLSTQIRLSLTYYNLNQFYTAKRIDSDEIFHVLAWDCRQVEMVLGKYIRFIINPKLRSLRDQIPSLFPNKRQVCLVTLRGS